MRAIFQVPEFSLHSHMQKGLGSLAGHSRRLHPHDPSPSQRPPPPNSFTSGIRILASSFLGAHTHSAYSTGLCGRYPLALSGTLWPDGSPATGQTLIRARQPFPMNTEGEWTRLGSSSDPATGHGLNPESQVSLLEEAAM